MKKLLLIFFLLFTLTTAQRQSTVRAWIATLNQSGSTVILSPSTTYQTMWGLGAVINQSGQHLYPSGQAVRDNPDWPAFRDTLLDQAVNDLGLTQVRLEIRSSAENTRDFWSEYKTGQITQGVYNCHRYSVVNDNGNATSINASGFHFTEMDETITKVVVPLRAVMAARGEVLHVNVCYVSFTDDMTDTGCPGGLSNAHNSNPAEYAEFVLATYRHIQSTFGFVPDTWEIMLEPSNGNNWMIGQMGPAIVAAGNLLSANGFTPRFVAPSNVTRATAITWFDTLTRTPGALQYMDTISFHTYNGWNDPSGLDQFASRANLYGLKTGMVEHIGATVDELHLELKHANISSFLQFVLASPSGTGNNRLFGISGTTVTVADFAARYFRQYFRHVRPHAVRIGAQSDSGTFDPLAFRNSNGGYVVVTKTTAGGTFNVQGLPAGLYGVVYTTATEAGVNLADELISSGEALSTSIPAKGVLTIYAKSMSAPPPCQAALSRSNQSYPAAGGTGTVGVTAQAGCSWTAVSNAAWINVTSGGSGSGNGPVNYLVAANASASPRTGTITIAGQTFTVTQSEAVVCSFSISPTNQSFNSGGGTGSVQISTLPSCSWSATRNAAWISITSGSSGTGAGRVNYSVTSNTTTSPRTGTITIAGQTFTVTQAGTLACSFSISPTSKSFNSDGGTGIVQVSTQTNCSWNATRNAAWISITSGSNGSGAGTVNYSVASNPTTSPRTGTINIAGQTFTVTQAGTLACSFTISPTSRSFNSGGGTGSVLIRTQTNCSWNATRNAAWISITSDSSGTEAGTVNYSVASNATTSPRTGTITIAGQTLTVTQAGTLACSFFISPTSQSFNSGGGTGIVQVSTETGCSWNAGSNVAWISITSDSSRTGTSTVKYLVASNISTSPRTGTITIAGRTFTISQAGSKGARHLQ